MRFVRKLALLVVALVIMIWAFIKTEDWHRATITNPESTLARQLRETPIGDDSLATYYIVNSLWSLGLIEDGQALSHYIARQLLLRALGEPPKQAATVAAALQSERTNDRSLDELRKRVLNSSFQVSLQHLPAITLKNKLHATITHYDLAISIDNAKSSAGDSMVDFKLRCVSGYDMSAIAENEEIHTNCMDVSSRRTNEIAETLYKVRVGQLALTLLPARVDIKVNSPEVTAIIVTERDVSFSGSSWENSKGTVSVHQSSCEQRGDCEAVIKRRVHQYTVYLEYAIPLLIGVTFGTFGRGVIALFTRHGRMRYALSVAFLTLSIGLVPFAWFLGGEGWRPFLAAFATGIILIGIFIGFVAEAFAGRNSNE